MIKSEKVLLKKYCSRLVAVERRSILTKECYRFEIGSFLGFIEEKNILLSNVNTGILCDYIVKRNKIDNLDARSVAKAISALRSFFRFAEDEKLIKHNPALALEIPKRRAYLPDVMDKEIIEMLLDKIDVNTDLGRRDKSIFELIYSAGLRVSETVNLNIHDIDLNSGIAIVRGKGDKERIVLFGTEAADQLKQYLCSARSNLSQGLNKSTALFIGRSGKRLSRKGIWKNYAKYACIAGVSS
ncbi:MAG: tyrosine-type recombinase/integrase, partial [Treponema sp.]|nr:tyrosine-type recombinase/integrase [Treponema sp.]